MKTYDVTKCGLVKNSDKNQRKELQALVDSIDEGIIYFPRGYYVLSTIFLKSHIHIKLAKGTKILGDTDFYAYAPQEEINFPIYQDQSHTYFDCSLFVGKNIEDISFSGQGLIDMRDCWDLDNVRDIVHRGPKVIALKECKDVVIKDLRIRNATDLAIYYAGCENVLCENLNLKVYIDGISPDCSKHCIIRNCYVESGDDGIVFKSSYTLNRLEVCDDILVHDCVLMSRCNAIKFGTESNGGFHNITCRDIVIFNCRFTGVSVESVDGAHISNLHFENIKMTNVGSPLFVQLGHRLRGPEGSQIGSIDGVYFKNIVATGPYRVYKCMAWNYFTYVAKSHKQFPGARSKEEKRPTGTWQVTSNVTGLNGHKLKNIVFEDMYFELDGGVKEYNRKVQDEARTYPEVDALGEILPAYGIYFRNVENPVIKNVEIKLLHEDTREKYIFD